MPTETNAESACTWTLETNTRAKRGTKKPTKRQAESIFEQKEMPELSVSQAERGQLWVRDAYTVQEQKNAAFFEKFKAKLHETEKLRMETVALFKHLDVDCNGYIDMDELRDGLHDHLQLDPKLAEEFMEDMDANHDQKISLEELWAAVQSASENSLHHVLHVNGLYQRAARKINGMHVFEQVPSAYEGENALHIAIANKAEIYTNVLSTGCLQQMY